MNNKQMTACVRHADAACFAYNWELARKQVAFAQGKRVPSAIDLLRELNALKKSKFSWLYAVSKFAPQEALRDLDQVFAHFFRRVKDQQAGMRKRSVWLSGCMLVITAAWF